MFWTKLAVFVVIISQISANRSLFQRWALARRGNVFADDVSVEPANSGRPEIYSLHVKSDIISRFAHTLVTSRLANSANKAKEAVFVVQLPNAAFISNFTMEIDDKIIIGEVKEKEKAKQVYDAAKAAGQSAGHVAQVPRETNTFHISVNVEAQGKVTFNLTYQEILQRVHGVYKHIVNIQPGQIVDDLRVDVAITEKREIPTILVPEFGSKIGEKSNQDLLKLPKAKDVEITQVITPELSRIEVSYQPKVKLQKKLEAKTGKGLAGQLVVLYDVERDQSGGEIQVVNGYFVHFFAPANLPVAKKHAIFVLDTSGSMSGRKIEQTKHAMRVILKDLHKDDLFNILEFDDSARLWRSESVQATKSNVDDASTFVDGLHADGGTNINEALQEALVMLLIKSAPETINPVIIFLTDGEATVGEIDSNRILSNAKQTNAEEGVSVQSIGFGSGADFDLLKRLSLENNGLARKVYEDSDAALQLQGFYAEISSLLLRDVEIKYLDETVEPESIVSDRENILYEGSEMVVVGKLKEPGNSNKIKFRADVDSTSAGGARSFSCIPRCRMVRSCDYEPPCFHRCPRRPPCVWTCDDPLPPEPHPTPAPVYEPLSAETIGGFVERMWAYLSIKNKLDKAKYDAKADSNELKKEALELSLRYNFVTELTSMVVTQPDKKKTALTEGDAVSSSNTESGQLAKSLGSFGGNRRGGNRGGGNRGGGSRGRRPSGSFGGSSLGLGTQGPSGGHGPFIDLTSLPDTDDEEDDYDYTMATHMPKPKPKLTTTRRPKTTTTSKPITCAMNETNVRSRAEGCETSCGQKVQKSKSCDWPLYCRCKKGYRRTAQGHCVKPADCPRMPKFQCSDVNAVLTVCGKNCHQQTCNSISKGRICKKCGRLSCACKSGYILDVKGRNGVCIRKRDC